MTKSQRLQQNERASANVKIIGAIARELRQDRNRPAAYAMQAARRYVRLYPAQVTK